MSKKDYTKYTPKSNVTVDEGPVVIDTPSFNVNVPAEDIPKEAKPMFGIVTDCIRLNVRVAPYSNAEVATTIDASTDVFIDESESTEDFYKVCTASGIEGFCMRKFITVTP
jgi:hypothetical protein